MKILLKRIAVALVVTVLLAMSLPVAFADGFTGYNCITTKEQLNSIRNSLSAKYYLGNDIEFTEADFAPGGAFYNNGKGWEPIGANGSNAFKGVFDGNGHTIKGLKINAGGGTTNFVGLFGYSTGAVSNVKLENVKITVSDSQYAYVGGVAGASSNKNISSCTVSGEVKITGITVQTVVGGIAGGVYSGTVSDCFNSAKIDVSNCSAVNAGGIAGYSGSKIYRSGNSGSVSAYGRSDVFCGGICGLADGTNTSKIAIIDSYNVGTVYADSICDCYSGGIVGDSKGEVSQVFNSGVVAGRANTYEFKGRVLGRNNGGTVSDAYYIADAYSAGDGITAITVQQAAQQSTFTNFDFDGTWAIQNGIPIMKKFVQTVEKEEATTPVDPPQINNGTEAGDAEGNGGLNPDPNVSNPDIPSVSQPAIDNPDSNDDPFDPGVGNQPNNTNKDPIETEKMEWIWIILVAVLVVLITAGIVVAAKAGLFTSSAKK